MEGTQKKKNNMLISLGVVVGLALVVVLGIVIGNLLMKGKTSNSKYAKILQSDEVAVLYNYNLFTTNSVTKNSAVTGYNENLQILNLNGKLNGTSIPLGKLMNTKIKAGEKYKITLNYVGGTFNKPKSIEPKFSFDLQKNSKNYLSRVFGVHFISLSLPTANNKTIEKTIAIGSNVANSTNFYYWLWQKESGAVTFNNYRIQIFVTKVDDKVVKKTGTYGSLPTPEKDGYEFLGWYTSLSGSDSITSTTKVSQKNSHTLYAHWEQKDKNTSTTPGVTCNLDNCEKCASNNVCSLCKTGYQLQNGKCVSQCTFNNCALCDEENKKCEKCKPGYSLNENGGCTSICDDENCASCDKDKCLKCNDGYDLLYGKCELKCNISRCEECSKSNYCSKCEEGFTVNDKGRCVRCNKSKCLQCNVANVCVKCASGYTVSEGKCKLTCNDKNCSNCKTSSVCLECKFGYTVKGGKCVTTCTLDNCLTCDTMNHCSKCATGYTLINGRCKITTVVQ